MSVPPPPPPPQATTSGPSAGDDRNLLLQSIRAGKTLRKTVTVDKSAPAISGECHKVLLNIIKLTLIKKLMQCCVNLCIIKFGKKNVSLHVITMDG